MIGELVIIPLGHGSDVEGIIEKYEPDSGAVVVKDEEGNFYKGYDYQLTTVE
jgi:hypothetical protein